MGTRAWKKWLQSLKPQQSPKAHKKAPPKRLQLVQLEDRSVPAVVPKLLAGGLLDIQLDARGDRASVSVSGGQLLVDTGAGTEAFTLSAVTGINAQGDADTDQTLSITGAFTLANALTAAGLEGVGIDRATIGAGSVNVAAAGPVVVTGSKLTSGGAVTISSAVTTAKATEGLLGAVANADAAVTVTDSTVSGSAVTITAAAAVTADAAPDSKEDTNRDLARVQTGATARVRIDGASQISSPGAVTIAADADTTATSTAQAKATSTDANRDAALALANLTAVATVDIAGTTAVTSGGKLTLLATNDAAATTTADGSAGGSGALGGSVARAVIDSVTRAAVTGQAALSAADIDISAVAGSKLITTAKSTSGGATSNDSDTKSQLAASGAKSAEGSVGLAGAFAFNNLARHETQAFVSSSGSVAATNLVRIGATSTADASAAADGSVTGGSGTTTPVGVGVAVAVDRGSVVNQAFLGGSGKVSGRSVAVQALTPAASDFAATAKAGAGAQNVGVAGAFALNAVSNASESLVRPGAAVDLAGSPLTLTATNNTTNVVDASPAGVGVTGAKVGVGASVALNTPTHVTRAEVENTAAVTGASDLALSATAGHTSTTTATTGAEGGIAVTPGVALALVTNTTTARLGIGGPLAVTGAVSLSAAQTNGTAATARSDAAGAKVAVGAALALTDADDVTEASVNRALTAGGTVSITANTGSTSSADGKSGARGATSTAATDDQVNQQRPDATRESASTSEGKLGAAAAIGINEGTAKATALVGTGASVTAGGTVTIDAANKATASAKADGTATVPGTNVGVGVAFALDAMKAETRASLDPNAKVTAGALVVRAAGSGHAFAADATSGAGSKKVGLAGALAINKVTNTTEATFEPGATAGVTGGVSLTADGQSAGTTTAAPAAGGATGATLGVGASVAVGAFRTTVRAEIEDEARLTQAGGATVKAIGGHAVTTTAQGGAGAETDAGAVAITPFVAVTAGTMTTAARVGKAAAGPSTVTGNLSVEADHTGAATTTASGSAFADKVGLGLGLALNIATDQATALVGSAKAGGAVTIRSGSATTGTADAKASARGGQTSSSKTVTVTVEEEKLQADQVAGTSTPSAPSAKAPDSTAPNQADGAIALAGAVGVNLGRSTTRAAVEDSGFLQAGGLLTVSSGHNADTTAKADGSTVAGQNPPPQGVGIAAAVAINAATVVDEATIGKAAVVSARGAKLETVGKLVGTDGVSTSAAAANSGAGATNLGVAGAFAINVANNSSAAAVLGTATVTAGTGATADDLTVSATHATANTATATATIPFVQGSTAKAGVGGSFAVVVADNDTRAGIDDAAAVTGANDVTVAAVGTHAQTGTTEAGTSGGTAVSPSAAVLVGAGDTAARLGTGPLLSLTGNLVVQTDHTSTASTKTSADAAGKSTAIGTTVALTIADDVSLATTARSVTAGGGVTVFAAADDNAAANAKASAAGGTDKQDGDGVADRFREFGQQVKATFSGNGAIRDKLRAELDKSRTQTKNAAGADGDTIGVAGAIGVNVALADTAARIGDGTVISAGGAVSVRTEADADQDADASGIAGGTSTDTAVGIAVAANVAVTKNEASVGPTASVTGNGITIDAGQPAADTRQLTAQAIGGGGAKKAGVAGSLAVNIVSDTTKAFAGNAAVLNSKAGITVLGESDVQLQAVAGGGAIGLQNNAVGAGVAVNVAVTDTRAFLDTNSKADAVGAISVTADAALSPVDGSIPNDPMAAAVGGNLSADTGFAGSAAVNVLVETTQAFVGGGTKVNTAAAALGGVGQSVAVRAINDDVLTSAAGVAQAGVGATQFGLGADVTVLTHDTAAFAAPSAVVRGGGDVTVEATSEEDVQSFAIAVGGSTTNQVSGAVSVYVPTTKTRAFFDSSSQGESNGNTRVTASHDADVRTFVGNGIGAGSNSIGGSFSVIVTDDTTDAFVGANAKLTARGATGLTVEAKDVSAVRPKVVGGGGAGGFGIAGSGGVTNLNQSTTAHIDGGAQLTAANTAAGVDPSVRVAATATTTLLDIAGAASGGGSGGIGAGAAADDLDKDTQAWVARGVVITADGDVAVVAESKEDVTSVSAAAGGGGSAGIAGAVGVVTLDVTTRAALGETPGVASGATPTQVTADRNVIVSADDRNEVDVIAGTAAGAGGAGVGGSVAVPVIVKLTEAYIAPAAVVQANGKAATTARTGRFGVTFGGDDSAQANEVHAPTTKFTDSDGDGQNDLTDGLLAGQRAADPLTASVRGVAVTATSRDDVETVAAGAAGSGGLAVGIGVPVTRINPTTKAFVGTGAKVNTANTAADPGQSVLVAAGSDVAFVGVGGAAAGAGGAAVGPAAAVAVITPTTQAFVANSAVVNAAEDVTVQADATQDALMVAAAAAGAGAAGVAGAVSVLKLDSATEAFIGQGQLATVTAGDTVTVAAKDTSDLDIVSGGAAFGLAAGVGASAGVLLIEKDTRAVVDDNASVEGRANGTGTGLRGVVIAADSKEDVLNVAAAGAGGFAGVAGGVGVTVVDSDTDARIDPGAKVNPTAAGAGALQDVSVTATNAVKVLSVGGGLAAGAAALGGGVDVGTVRNDTSALIDTSAQVRAAGDVSVVADGEKDVRSVAVSGAAGIVGLNASASVWSVGTAFSATYTDESGVAGRTVRSRNALDDGDGTGSDRFADQHAGNQAALAHSRATSGLTAFNSADTTLSTTTPTPVQRLGQTLRGGVTGLTGLPSSATVTSGLSSTAAQPGTTAVVAAGATVTAGDAVTVAARDDVDVNVTVGGVSAGGGAIGASVGVLKLGGKVDTHVAGTIDAGGNVLVEAALVNQDPDVNAFAGRAGLVGLGAAVAQVRDTSTRTAFLASTADVQRAATLTVQAKAVQNQAASAGTLAVAGIQAGATYATVFTDGSTSASIDGGAKVGQTPGKAVNNVVVLADVNADADTDVTANSAGLLTGDINFARSAFNPTVTAAVRGGALVAAGNDVSVTAVSDMDATADTNGANAGGAAFGQSFGLALALPTTTALVENATIQAGHDVSVVADAERTVATADSEGSAGGVIVGAAGSIANASAQPIVRAEVRSAVEFEATIAAGNDVTVRANGVATADADANNATAGFIAVGSATGEAIANPDVTATVGGGSLVDVTAGQDILIESKSAQTAVADADSRGTGLVPQSTATGNARADFDVLAVASDNAVLQADNQITVRSVIDNAAATVTNVLADGRGIGGGSEATAIANVGNGGNDRGQLTTEIDGQAILQARHVVLSAVIESESVDAESDALDTGASVDGNTNAFSRADIAVTATVRLETGSTVTGTESVDIDARHDSASNNANAFSDDFLGAVGTASTTRANQVTDALVDAQNSAFVTTRNLAVDARHTATSLTSVAVREAIGEDNTGDQFKAINPTRRITWNATTTVLGAPDPELVIDANGNVTKAVGVTISDTDGVTLGPVAAATIVVNPIAYPAPADQVKLTANTVTAFGNTVDGVVTGTLGDFNFARSPGKVTITNLSAKPLTVNGVNVIGTGQPVVVIQAESVPIAFNTNHLYQATEVTVENAGPAGSPGITLNGTITNPAGMTRVRNDRGNVTATGTGLIETRDLDLSAAGAVGTAASPVRVNVVQGNALKTAIGAAAGADLHLQLAGRQRRTLAAGTPFTVFVDTLQAGTDLDLRLADGLVQTTEPATRPTNLVRETNPNPDVTTTVISRFRPPSEEFPPALPLGVFGTGTATTDTRYNIAAAKAGGTMTIAEAGTKEATLAGGFTAAGKLTFTGPPSFAVQIGGATPATAGFDPVSANGVSLTGTTLKLTTAAGVNPATGTVFTLVNNTGTAAVGGTFAGLAEGATVLAGTQKYTVSYVGGTGNNDVTLTRISDNNPSAFAQRSVTPVDENGEAVLSGRIVEPDAEDTFQLTISWGDGTTEQHLFPAGGDGKLIELRHRYRDNAPDGKPFAVDLDWRDPQGGGKADRLEAVVRNVAPTVDAGADQAGKTGQPVRLTAAAADPGPDDPTAVTWVVRDAAGNVVADGTGAAFAFTPTEPGVYTATARAADDDGGATEDAVTITVTRSAEPPQRTVAVAADAGSPTVRVLDAGTGQEMMSIQPYAASFTGGVRVATGDVTGDGVADIVTAAGPGGGPHLQVFDGKTGNVIASFFAYSPGFSGGVFVATGDLDGDGKAEIVTGAGAGGGAHVRAFDGAGGKVVREFFAYDPAFRGGVTVAVGDLDGDGRGEIVTGPATAGGPHVRAFDGLTLAEEASFFAYSPGFSGGVFVATGDLDGDGIAEIVTGAGAGGAAHVRVFGASGGERFGFFADATTFLGGVRVGVGDADGDGRGEIVAATGPTVRLFDGRTAAGIGTLPADEFGFQGGVFVG